MKRIILHWTGGTNQPNSKEFEHYHYLVNGDGLTIMGKYKPEDNLNCNDKKYAQHTGGGNTGSIGVAMCGMYGYVSPNHTGAHKLTKMQCEAMFKLVAKISYCYNIPVTSDTIMTHYEFAKKHPKTSSAGKIDITYLPPYPEQAKDKIGDFIRNKIKSGVVTLTGVFALGRDFLGITCIEFQHFVFSLK